jgi:hypothetical protein
VDAPSQSADPQAAVPVHVQAHHVVVDQRARLRGSREEALEFHPLRVEAVEALLRTDPERAVTGLLDGVDAVVAE